MAIVAYLAFAPVAQSAPNGLIDALRQMDRNVCKSMTFTCKKKAAARSKKKSKNASVAAAAPKKPVKEAAADAAPEPIKKAARPVKEQAPIEKAAETKKVVQSKSKSQPKERASTLKLDDVLIEPPVQSKPVNPPIPEVKPIQPATTIAKSPPLPPQKPEVQKPIVVAVLPRTKPPVEAAPLPANGDCLKQLRGTGAEFVVATDAADKGQCHVENPVHLKSVGSIALPEAPLLNCRYAVAFSRWLSDSANPLARSKGYRALKKVSTGPGYECRGRNGDSSAKLSEHGRGNAVDITTFTFADGKTIAVSDAGNSSSGAYNMLKAIRTSACAPFTTVLGPGSNAAHASHFHLDLGTHGKSGTYRICE
jgi:hypothetical protein